MLQSYDFIYIFITFVEKTFNNYVYVKRRTTGTQTKKLC